MRAMRVTCSSPAVTARCRWETAFAGCKEMGLFFTGANKYRLNEIISVKELFEKLINGENN